MDPVQLLPIVGILLVFYLLLIRPQAKRARQQSQMQNSVGVGDHVMLTSGFYGTLVGVAEDRIEVELAPDVVVTVARAAVGRVESVEPVDAEQGPDVVPPAEPATPTLAKRDAEER